jgi:hypothetical protein
MAHDINADHITQYLDGRDDFDLELFACRALKERGWVTHHGGMYIDPIAGKPRQYDVQARYGFSLNRDLALSVECKSLSTEFPLIVSRVPRDHMDCGHDVVRQWRRSDHGDTAFSIQRTDSKHLQFYGFGQMVGKSTTQIRWSENGKKLIASDADTYDKWSQALASATELVRAAAHRKKTDTTPTFTFVMPILLVSNGALWVVDYTEEGERNIPTSVDEALLYVDREHEIQGRYGNFVYHMSNLHVYTRAGFVSFLNNLASPTGLLLERIFGSALRSIDGQNGSDLKPAPDSRRPT